MINSQKLLFIVRFIYLTFAVIVVVVQFQTVSTFGISCLNIKQAPTYIQGMAPLTVSLDTVRLTDRDPISFPLSVLLDVPLKI